MAKQTGTFVDEARLVPRDNSFGPLKSGGDFGDGGKTVGGETANGGKATVKAPSGQRSY